MGRRPVARVVSRSTFGALRRPSGRGRSGPIVAIFAPLASGDGRPELAFAVSKRCGGAVERNLIRRRLRAAADHLAADLRAGAYLVRTDPGVLDLTYAEVIHNLRVAVAKATKTSKELSNGA